MALTVTHPYVSPVVDEGDPNRVGPDEWNANHTVTGTLPADDIVFTPAGAIAATDVQAAIEELDSEKQPLDAGLTDIAALAVTDSNIIVGNGTNWVAESGATARTSLGLAIGTDVQAFDSDLSSWASVTRAAGFDTFAATPSSTNLASLVTGETGTGALVFADTPTLIAPLLGTPTSGVLTNATGLPLAGLATTDPNLDQLIFRDDTDGVVKLATNSLIASEAAPTSGDFFLMYGAEGDLRKVNFDDMPSGTGDVAGPASSLDNAVARFHLTTGKIIQDSLFVVGDTGHVTSFGGNITFPATQAASADANTLDDYEEGTFTPTLTFGGAAVGMTFTTQTGVYTKIGNIVHFTIRMVLSAKGSSTGSALISGLPFTVDTTTSAVVNLDVYTTGAGVIPMFTINSGGATILPRQFNQSTGALTTSTDAVFNNTTVLTIAGTYRV